ncbi:MAG TPA: SAM-dependent methyltransferase [Stellaceae bacterium]|nr:SAM-dependent methyltransferase [Stellaceae bacterium]
MVAHEAGGRLSATGLAAKIARRIRAEGPISIAAYMAMALHDPEHGYYRRQQPIGRDGDFTTAPEISQIFGELIGLWCADLWQRLGEPAPVFVVELGPGRGALADDFLRAAESVPGFRRALRLVLVEASPVLRAAQAERIGEASFADDLDAVPDGPMLLVANEFLDALPVRQFVRGPGGWAERLVAVDKADRLILIDSNEHALAAALVPPALRDSPHGTVVEISPAATALSGAIAARLTRHPGAALLIDYGHAAVTPGPTLAAIRRHARTGLLDEPGAADLSAHVDFAAVRAAAEAAGAAAHGPVPQGEFLAALGAGARLSALCARATVEQREMLALGLRRLIDPREMGTLFKALALVSPGLPAPAGFEEHVTEPR